MRVARVHRLAAAAPDDVSALAAAFSAATIAPAEIVAILGKTEGNGCVNDFTRGFATATLKALLARMTGRTAAEIERAVAMVMSGGTEGGLSPHWLVFTVGDDPRATATATGTVTAAAMGAARGAATGANGRLAVGTAMTRRFLPEEIGRSAQVRETAAAVRQAIAAAAIADVADVHYVQVKCPLLTKARIAEAAGRGAAVATADTYASMAYSRGASALGVAAALGEIDADTLDDARILADRALFSARAATSAGIELMENQVMVVGNSAAWGGALRIAHAVMQDAIDLAALPAVLAELGLPERLPLAAATRARIVAVLAKAEAASDGAIRGRRHVMLDDSDIPATRHARALVGGVLAGGIGDTQLFVSGGAEHQGPDGGGPLAVIAAVE
jgi:cyanuric acid amidohydrolase